MLLGLGQMYLLSSSSCFWVLPGNPWETKNRSLRCASLICATPPLRADVESCATICSIAQRGTNSFWGMGSKFCINMTMVSALQCLSCYFFLELNRCLQIITKRGFTSPNAPGVLEGLHSFNCLRQTWRPENPKFGFVTEQNSEINVTLMQQGLIHRILLEFSPHYTKSFCCWNREYFWLWFWWLLTSLSSTISLELVRMGKTMCQPSLVLTSWESHRNRMRRGLKAHVVHPASVFPGLYLFKRVFKNVS